MVAKKWYHYQLLIKRVVFLLFTYMLSRVVFGLMNPETFSGELFDVLMAGFRYDITVICILNSPVILLHLYPSIFSNNNLYQSIISFLIIVVNSIAILLNSIDACWYSYTQKRSTFELFNLIFSGGEDVSKNVGQYLIDYWFILVFWIVITFLLFYFERNLRMKLAENKKNGPVFPSTLIRFSLMVLIAGLAIIGFRGGLQLKPLSVQASAKMVPSESIPLVLNTPYTIIKSMDDDLLNEPAYMSDEKARAIFNIHQQQHPDSAFNKMNVVILIMESFSHEYISFYHPEQHTTPFLDSLMRVSACWPNSFANAKRSIEGIPAITVSLPSLMDQAFINSAYNVSRINSLASILNKEGYTSGFFHGGNNGTMGFDNFAQLAGYQKYYGRNEYDGPKTDYDGHWGIFDHAYLSFMTRTIGKWKEPFTATFFSVSSHHPYTIPPAFLPQLPKGITPVEKGMAYADASLKLFFENAKKQPWFKNTIFVITPDHSGPAKSPYYANRLGAYHIPILFYMPGKDLQGIHTETAQQGDILPSVLHLLNYPGKYSAFGRDLFTKGNGWSINYTNNSWQLITDDYVLQFDGQESTRLFLRSDSLLKNNILPLQKSVAAKQEYFLKAILQQYRYGFIHNQLVLP